MKKHIKLLITSIITLMVACFVLPAKAQAFSNLVLNPGAETATVDGKAPLNWQHTGWGSNTAAYSYKTASGQGGSTHSVYSKVTNYIDGDAKWFFDPVAVTPNTTYLYGDWYKSDVASTLVAVITMADGSTRYEWMADLGLAISWKRASALIIMPPGSVNATVYHMIGANGYVQLDNVILKQPEVPIVTNGIGNSSFEQAAELDTKLPRGWANGNWGTNTSKFSYLATGHTGTKSVRVDVSGYLDGDAKWYADAIKVQPGTTYVYSDWYKASVPTDIVAMLVDGNGNESYQWLGTAASSATKWATKGYSLTIPSGVVSASILHTIASNGYLIIDDVSLVPPTTPDMSSGVPNGAVEQTSQLEPSLPLSWSHAGWGTNTTKYSYITSGHNATKSVRIDVTKYTDGDAKWFSEPITTTPNTDVAVSDYYRSNVDTAVVAQLNYSDGSLAYIRLKNALATTTWAAYADQLSIPPEVTSVTIYHLIDKVGYLETDDYSLRVLSSQTGFSQGLVSLTFDDGWDSIYNNAIPLLTSYNMPSTQYLVSGFLNTPGYVTSAQVVSMYLLGHEVASHSVTHSDLTTLSATQLQQELTNSQSTLSGIIGAPVVNFATPYGAYNAAVLGGIGTYYQSHRSVDVGYNTRTNFDRYNIRTQDITATTTPAQVSAWVQKAKTDKSWLVLVFHQVDQSGDAYSTTPALLDQELAVIKQLGISVQTVKQAIATISPQL